MTSLSQRPADPIVGETHYHESALEHVTGRALYTNDLGGRLTNLLHAYPVQSTIAHAELKSVDTSAAYEIPGVVRVITAEDIPGVNDQGTRDDEPMLPVDEIMFYGQPIAWVFADTLEAAKEGAAHVSVEVEELPSLITIQDAIEAESFQGVQPVINKGDLEGGFQLAEHVFTGEFEFAGQDHFYLETQASLAQIDENGQLFINSSTQHPTETQDIVAQVLGVPAHEVTVQVVRMGGAFGGKEMQSHGYAAVAALGATLTGRPTRVRLNRTLDMTMTGKRHGFHASWKVGFTQDGKIIALDATLTSDGGWSMDLSVPVLTRALCHIDNGYWVPNIRVHGRIAKCNKTSQTAFRGFGGPQGMLVMEDLLGRVAPKLGLSPAELRRRNFYSEGQDTPYYQPVRHADRLKTAWDQVISTADIEARQAAIGSASMDESMVTGESKTVRRGQDDHVVAGTVATDSGLRVEVTAIGDDTALAGIQKLVADAQASSSKAQRIADTAAGWLFWFALGAAVITALVWSMLGMPDAAVVRTITVLVIACPHALGLAIPLVVSIATERAARGGVLIKDRLALESMRTVDSVLFDKTGTLTKGEPTVTGIHPVGDHTEDDILALAAAAETDSEHPLATAIVGAARTRDLDVPGATDFSSSPAVGVKATVKDTVIEVGGPYLLDHHAQDELAIADQWRDEGAIILHVLADGQIIGALRLADEIRPESRDTVDALHAHGVQVVMITGDAQAVADTVAHELGIDRVFAGVRPEDKAAKVAELQAEGRKVAMVGDGVNDAPALAQADVGIAIGAGTDVAIGSAGVILASSDPRSVLSVFELSQASYRKMKQNLWWAAGYNIAAVPLAAGVLAPIGFVLPMSVGAILMSASTVVVALNAQLLRRLDLTPAASVARSLDRAPETLDA